ncbi:reverse transcriptase [Sesbania bispinosa]|nr:reverse transcriptase [Sesbania bispinosa]
MRPPSNTKETQQLLGKLGYIRRFIPALGELISPLCGLLREKTPFVWGKVQQESFDQIKRVITSPQVMSPPVARHPLKLYLAVTGKSISRLIAQEVEGVERPVCYLSKVLKDVETRYPKQERYCLALVYAAQKYRHYFQAQTMEVMTKSEGIKYMLQNPSPTGRVSRWALMLSEYDLRVVHPQRLRSQSLVDMLAISSEGCEEHIVEEIKGEMPEVNMCEGVHGKDWWTLQFDGTLANPAGGVGVVLSNGKEEEGVRKMDNLHHAICGDLGPSLYRRMQRVGMFWPTLKMHCDAMQRMCKRCCTLREELEVNLVDEDWRAPLKKFLNEGELPMKLREAAKLKKKSERYFCKGDELFRNNFTTRMMVEEGAPREAIAEVVEEIRAKAEDELLKHHRRLALAYEKMVKPRMFHEGELVLKATDVVTRKQHTSKWAPNWEGPYTVKEARDNGCCTLMDPEDQREIGPINFKYVKKYYA